MGADHLPQIPDLPEVVHARLDHRRLVARLQAEKGEGHADVVVEVAGGAVDPEVPGQHGGDHLLGGGLPHTAGDLDEGDVEFIPVMGGQGLQGQAGVRHLDIKPVLPQRLRQGAAQAPRRSLF